MKPSEIFALDNTLSEYPNDVSFDDVIDMVKTNDDSVTIWEVFEDIAFGATEEFIEIICNLRDAAHLLIIDNLEDSE